MASTPRTSLAELLGDIDRLRLIFAGWDESPRGAAEAYGRSIEALNAEALRRLIDALKGTPAAMAALREAVSDEVIYAVLRRHQILKPSLTERVEGALASVRPMLASHSGDVELVSIDPPSISVRFLGSCDGCPASALTFHEGVKKAIEAACPEITEVRQVKGSSMSSNRNEVVSPFALDERWSDAAAIDHVPDGGVRAVEVRGEKVLLARKGDAVTCFQNACAHLGLELDDGEVHNGILTCPHHGFQYDLETGECLTASTVALQPHPVRVANGRVHVKLGP
jgi:nitrite reductase/ring-hydroxylating ferredoxin subunit/Fe-S cluster biogenesis protein NfuA